jgi:hypothetical protein
MLVFSEFRAATVFLPRSFQPVGSSYEPDPVLGAGVLSSVDCTAHETQSQFARRFGFSARTLQDWELGRAKPPSAVRAYLTVIDRFPETVEKALLGAA